MEVLKSKTLKISEEKDLLNIRGLIREYAGEIGLPEIFKVKLLTATSEVARNVLKYAGSGRITIRILSDINKGIEIICEDNGKGIDDVDAAMKKGFSTSGSLGLGLPGARSLVHVFHIDSKLSVGTRVRMIVWRK
ncbi:anti-sigma regulatory factor [Chondrinema litorale]|uniref:anti-sigma regulatory factor n=1 Tax=Chondrinema litorale TaxID=2994555 RepID=UPI002542DA24|nr:anti-sigma regulatory factor [Chondrinema litorale]UZR98886.1 anti-sigma regulatory factor [Chondrinema litorale]